MKEKYEYQIGYLNKILKIFSQILYYNLKDLKCFTVKPIWEKLLRIPAYERKKIPASNSYGR